MDWAAGKGLQPRHALVVCCSRAERVAAEQQLHDRATVMVHPPEGMEQVRGQ